MYWPDIYIYLLGVALAIASGIVNNVGMVFQKKVVNDIPAEARQNQFFRTLLKNPLWLIGLVLQIGVGSIFFMLAQVAIGPALIPGLMAAGLIVLALASVKMVGETLHLAEIIGILLMILGVSSLGFSGLVIDIMTNILDPGLLVRIAVLTVALVAIAGVCQIGQRWSPRYRGILLAIVSGNMFALSNFWVFPLVATIAHVFSFTFVLPELIIFVLASAVLILTNIFGISQIQSAFKFGQASLLVPIQQIPVQVTPALVYLLVFLLVPPTVFSLLFLIVAILLIIISSFLLAKRQAQMESIS